MSDLHRVVTTSGADHQIDRTESRRIVEAAGGSHTNLVKELRREGYTKGEADGLADRIETQAKDQSATEPAAVTFPVPAPLKSDKAVTFATSAQGKIDLLRSASQVNSVVGAIGNNVCGGAAIVSALILDSKSVEAAKANAQAIRDTAADLGMLTRDYDSALDRMASGTMSPGDVQRLQVLLYAMTQQLSGDSLESGANSAELGGVVGMLRARGAFQHTDKVTFNLNMVQDATDSENLVPHWTVDVDGTHVSTWANDGHDRSAIVAPATGEPDSRAASWVGEVKTHPGCDFIAINYKDDANGNADVRLRLPLDKANQTGTRVWSTLGDALKEAWRQAHPQPH